jgi:hypothetical protein
VACDSREGRDAELLASDANNDVIFLAQNVAAAAVMEALFEGRVINDPAGCLRLDSVDDATVVWPKGFSLVQQGGEYRIRDAGLRDVGRIGGVFRFGGGEVPYLHDGIALSVADRELGQTRCPGKFWIVGDVATR